MLRAAFFTTALGMECNKLTSQFVRSLKGRNKSNSPSKTLDIDLDQHGAAVKELIVASLWLATLEIEPDQFPDWLHSFLLDCLTVSDRLHEGPAARELVAIYRDEGSSPNICQRAAFRLCNSISPDEMDEHDMTLLHEMLIDAKTTRTGALLCALNEDPDVLKKMIKTYT